MAKPTTHAVPICLALTVLAGLGTALGIATREVWYPIASLIPTVAYEAYRTEGRSTRWASWSMAVLIVALVVVRAAGFEFDLRQLLGTDVAYLGGEDIPLGDLGVVFPTAMALLALVLWTRTRGVYTRWLAGIIFATSAVVVYLTAPEALGDVLDSLT